MLPLAIAIVVIFALWLGAQALGFSISLVGSLVATIVLTLIVNFVTSVIRRRGGYAS